MTFKESLAPLPVQEMVAYTAACNAAGRLAVSNWVDDTLGEDWFDRTLADVMANRDKQ
jgi:hypothetical protein